MLITDGKEVIKMVTKYQNSYLKMNNFLSEYDLKKFTKPRLILGEAPYKTGFVEMNNQMNSRRKLYPFDVAAFISENYNERIAFYVVMKLLFGKDLTIAFLDYLKKESINEIDFVWYLADELNVYFGNISEKLKLRSFVNKRECFVLACGKPAYDEVFNLIKSPYNRDYIIHPSLRNFNTGKATRMWLMFNSLDVEYTRSKKVIEKYRILKDNN